MNAPHRDWAVVLAGSLLALAACRRSPSDAGDPRERVGTTTLTGAVVYVPSDIAREQVAQARCEQQRRCEHIEDSYLSECIAQAQAELQARVSPKACPRGVDEPALRVCLDWTAHDASCDDERDRAKRKELCDPAKLCPRP